MACIDDDKKTVALYGKGIHNGGWAVCGPNGWVPDEEGQVAQVRPATGAATPAPTQPHPPNESKS